MENGHTHEEHAPEGGQHIATAPPPKKVPGGSVETSENVIIRPLPKIVFLYPTWLLSIICGILVSVAGRPQEDVGVFFLFIFFANITVFAFEFTRMKTVALILFVLVLVFAGLFINTKVALFDSLRRIVAGIDIRMNAAFYWFWAGFFGLVYCWAYVTSRFNYWEIKHNEILHHHGFMGDVLRFPAPGTRMTKEIPDLVEFALLLSGRIILAPPGTAPIVLENIPRVNRAEAKMQRLLGSLSVEMTKH
jgi:hypothetical protein